MVVDVQQTAWPRMGYSTGVSGAPHTPFNPNSREVAAGRDGPDEDN